MSRARKAAPPRAFLHDCMVCGAPFYGTRSAYLCGAHQGAPVGKVCLREGCGAPLPAVERGAPRRLCDDHARERRLANWRRAANRKAHPSAAPPAILPGSDYA